MGLVRWVSEGSEGLSAYNPTISPLVLSYPQRRRSLLLGFALALDIGAMGAFVGLDIFEFALFVPDSVELFSGAAAVRGATCFAWHMVPFVDT